MSKVVVVGGGAAGMMAALAAAEAGNDVILLEKNEKLGKKIYITGKGRCNLTNACGPEDFFDNVEKNKKFLYSAYYSFDPDAVMDFFKEQGLALKIERGNRVFPESDHASDVTRTLEARLKKQNVDIRINTAVTGILTEDIPQTGGNEKQAENKGLSKKAASRKVTGVVTKDGDICCDSVILATGGVSYPSTGSTGDGIGFAESLGIKHTELYPSLVPLETKEEYIPRLQGLTLKNVVLSVRDDIGFSEMGELLFTHFGISGPLGLSLSCRLTEGLFNGRTYRAGIDLKPALSEEQLKDRIIRDVKDNPKKSFSNILPKYVPGKLTAVFEELLDFDCGKNMSELSRDDRGEFISLLKEFSFTITGTRGFNEAIITRGGISAGEINPSTMEAKSIRGLFFAGELVDVDARTGGYNLQIAWSTGRLAGLNA